MAFTLGGEFNSSKPAKALPFKDSSFLENVIDFVGSSRKAQAEKPETDKLQTESVVGSVQKLPDDPQVKQADFRVETGVFFDLDKGADDCDDESDDEDGKKSKLKKLLFFLPSSTNSTHVAGDIAVSVASYSAPDLESDTPKFMIPAEMETSSSDQPYGFLEKLANCSNNDTAILPEHQEVYQNKLSNTSLFLPHVHESTALAIQPLFVIILALSLLLLDW